MKVFRFIFCIALNWTIACKIQCDLQAQKKLPSDTAKIYIYGEIYDLKTKEIMPNATMYIEGTKTGAMADQNGKYQLDITAYSDTTKVYKFICHYVSYQVSHAIVKSKLSKSTKLDFEMIGTEGDNYVTYKMDRKTCTLRMVNRTISEIPPRY